MRKIHSFWAPVKCNLKFSKVFTSNFRYGNEENVVKFCGNDAIVHGTVFQSQKLQNYPNILNVNLTKNILSNKNYVLTQGISNYVSSKNNLGSKTYSIGIFKMHNNSEIYENGFLGKENLFSNREDTKNISSNVKNYNPFKTTFLGINGAFSNNFSSKRNYSTGIFKDQKHFEIETNKRTSKNLNYRNFETIPHILKKNKNDKNSQNYHTLSKFISTQNKIISQKLHTTSISEKNLPSKKLDISYQKRPARKRSKKQEDIPGQFTIVAYATAEEYNLENLLQGLKKQNLYEPNVVDNVDDVIHVVAKYLVETEPREIYFFREGTVIFWNVSELECSNVLTFLKNYEENSYDEKVILGEAEHMVYTYAQSGKSTHISPQGKILFSCDEECEFEKYAFSNAMSLSVKLSQWEAQLDSYVNSIEHVTEDLRMGNKIKLSQDDVLRKHGQLFLLRHNINLSSDLLDVPDFYWDRQNLENIYCQTCGYFSINRRTRVMNEKLNHCVELIELLSDHLSDKHHVRLEWMIIALITVEVGFETLHYIERYLS